MSMYMQQLQTTEREVFKMSATAYPSGDVDLKSIIHIGDLSGLFSNKVPKIIDILYRQMKIDVVQKMIIEMEAHCQNQSIPVDAEAGAAMADLKDSIDWFRYHFIEYVNCATGEILIKQHFAADCNFIYIF